MLHQLAPGPYRRRGRTTIDTKMAIAAAIPPAPQLPLPLFVEPVLLDAPPPLPPGTITTTAAELPLVLPAPSLAVTVKL